MPPHRDQIVVAERARTANICVLAIKIVLRPPATRRFAIPPAQFEYGQTVFSTQEVLEFPSKTIIKLEPVC